MGYWDKKEPAVPEPEEREQADSLENVEAECLEEMGEVEKGFRERMKAENDRFRDMCDTEYWGCLCFKSRAQKEEFLQSVGMETDLKYIDGREMARAVKRPVRTPDLQFAKIKAPDKEFSARAMDI